MNPSPPQGMLFVAADVAAADDADFNDWYDHEHVEERARLPGFVSAARYESVGRGRRYLGLYRTESLAAFLSPAYRAAFERQTPWSVANLGRMVDPMRRVCGVSRLAGQGSGAWLTVLPMAEGVSADGVAACARALAGLPGFVRAELLVPDAALSSPLPTESTAGRRLEPLLVLESGDAQADAAALATVAESLRCDVANATRYALRWILFSHELAR